MEKPSRRRAPTGSRGHTYSAQRLRLVLTLLTVITLPVVIASSVLIYYFIHYNVMVNQRLQGERWLVPARLYARPLTLRGGLPMTVERLVGILNGLRYEQSEEVPRQEGRFAAGNRSVVFTPRDGEEGIVVAIEKGRIKELRGLTSKKLKLTQTLEPELITYLFDESREKRRIIKFEELPDHLVKAVLAIEDRRFFSHPGLDPFRIFGAALRNLRADSYIQGGSTITQQLVKNFFLTPERTFRRKAQEAMLAFVLERRAEKKDILELYLNEIYLGQVGSFSIHGVGEASRLYFHKDVGNLTIPEAALLAGMIQSPNPLNPYRHPKKATERRNVVLRAMHGAGFLDEAQMNAALAEPMKVQTPSVDATDAPYFVDLVREQMAARYAERNIATQNLAVYTSLDPPLQALAQDALRKGLERLDKMVKRKGGEPLQGCLIAVEPVTGQIVALVGGRSYIESQYNRVTQARRQPGSTFKPFVYLTAFEATFDDPSLPPITPATVVEDAPSVFFFGNKEYRPSNYEGHYGGAVTLRKALALSMNVATVKVAEMVGYDRVANMWTRKLKISDNVKPYPAVALGSFEASPLQMATAYNVLANGGLKVEPTTLVRVVDEKGVLLDQQSAAPARVVHQESSFLVTHMLRSVMNSGTAAQARGWGFTADAAGKTGTTNDMRDAWFAGYTPDLLCIVWIGFDDNTPINLSGAKAALPIWVEFMKGALAGLPSHPFTVPPANISIVEIDPQTGQLVTPYCPSRFSEAFIVGTEPSEQCTLHGLSYYSTPSLEGTVEGSPTDPPLPN